MRTAQRPIVVGAAAGGLSALITYLVRLDATLMARICVVMHRPEARVHVDRTGCHLLGYGPRIRSAGANFVPSVSRGDGLRSVT